MSDEAWGGTVSAKGLKRVLMKTPLVAMPQLSEGQALKMAIQSYPFMNEPRLQALLGLSDEDAAAEFARLEREADAGLSDLNPVYRAMLRMR